MTPKHAVPESGERRRRPRIATMMVCEIRIGEQPAEVFRIRDLSECGIKIATRQRLLLGDRLRVRLPGAAEWTLARVVWRSDDTAGLAFVRAISLTGLLARPAPITRSWTERLDGPGRMAR